MGRFPKLPKSLYFSGIVAAHPRSSAKVSRESVEHGDCAEYGAPPLSAASTNAGKMATGGAAALVQIFARTVKGMPKWVVYCGQCNRPSTYNQIDDSTIDLAAPAAKKPPLSGEGEGWGMPLVQAKVAGQGLRSDVQPRVTREGPNRVDERKNGSAGAARPRDSLSRWQP